MGPVSPLDVRFLEKIKFSQVRVLAEFSLFLKIKFTKVFKYSQGCDPWNVAGIRGATDPSPREVCRNTRVTIPAFVYPVVHLNCFNGRNYS